MTIAQRKLATGLVGVGTATALIATTVPAQAADLELAARMRPTAGYHQARGHAEYEADRSGREFDIQIAGVWGLRGKRLTVRVHGSFVGTMVVTRYGRAHLERRTAVRMRAGDVVRVRTPAGALVTYGKFYREAD
jgi:hypothetical protein